MLFINRSPGKPWEIFAAVANVRLMLHQKLLIQSMIAAVASLSFLGASPAPSPPAIPIHINSCSIKTAHSQMGFGGLFVNGKGYNFFDIAFTNAANETAKRVVFQVEFAKSRYVVGDNGSFAPGQKITHLLRDHGKDVHAFARTGTGPTECAVLSVHFSNGTSWTAPAQP